MNEKDRAVARTAHIFTRSAYAYISRDRQARHRRKDRSSRVLKRVQNESGHEVELRMTTRAEKRNVQCSIP
jgi:hypothetical protein